MLCICNVIYCYIMMLAGIKLCIPTQARSTDGHLPRSSWTSRPQAQGSSFKFYSARQKKTDAVRASTLICSRHQIPTVIPSIRACAKGPDPLWKGKGWPPPNKNIQKLKVESLQTALRFSLKHQSAFSFANSDIKVQPKCNARTFDSKWFPVRLLMLLSASSFVFPYTNYFKVGQVLGRDTADTGLKTHCSSFRSCLPAHSAHHGWSKGVRPAASAECTEYSMPEQGKVSQVPKFQLS